MHELVFEGGSLAERPGARRGRGLAPGLGGRRHGQIKVHTLYAVKRLFTQVILYRKTQQRSEHGFVSCAALGFGARTGTPETPPRPSVEG